MIENPIMLFDGECNLCVGAVQFFIKENDKKNILYASLQGNYGQTFLQKNKLDNQHFQTFIFFENQNIYTKSTAALKALLHLKWHWKIFYILIIIPPFIRDYVYNFVSKNRYKWFGKKKSCWIPNESLNKLFLN